MEPVLDSQAQEQPTQKQTFPQKQQQTPLTKAQKSAKRALDLSQGFWLTEAQKIYIQHKLPRLYSLIAVPHNSRLMSNSKMLEQESIQFIKNKRGRPEGSFKSIQESPEKSRRSIRLKKEERKADSKEIQDSRNDDSQENEELYQVSCAKQLQFSRSASKFQPAVDYSKQIDRLSAEKSKESKESRRKLKERECKQEKGQQSQAKKEEAVLSEKIIEKVEMKENKSKAKKKKQAKSATKQQQLVQDVSEKPTSLEKEQQKPKDSLQNSELCVVQATQKQQPLPVQVKGPDQAQSKQQVNDQNEGPLSLQAKKLAQKEQEEVESKVIQLKFAAQLQILSKLKTHENILPFLQPVDEERDGAPGYYSIITKPIDIQTIQFKLTNSIYKNSSQFHLDIKNMWANARTYNKGNNFMQKITNILEKFYCKLAKIPFVKENKPKEERKKTTKGPQP